jgi:hypothetical protein
MGVGERTGQPLQCAPEPVRLVMSRHTAYALVAIATAGVIGCESPNGPVAPSLVTSPPEVTMFSTSRPLAAKTAQARPISADPVVIDRGQLDVSAEGGELTLYGTRGFSLTAPVTRSSGIVAALDTCFASNCVPGAEIALLAQWSGNDLPATVTLDGVTYSQVGSLTDATSGLIQFTGVAAAPPLGTQDVDAVKAPFTVTGAFTHEVDGELVTVPFAGEGVVKVWLVHQPSGIGWSVQRLLYRVKHEP